MNDRELLELAAKAAGIQGEWGGAYDIGGDTVDCTDLFFILDGEALWNPLTDDGDALRMVVKLRMEIGFEGDNVVFADGNFSEFLSEDPAAATRRAIVRAAAEIGKAIS